MAIYRGYNWYNSIFLMVEALSSAFQGKWWGAFLGGPLVINPIYTIGYHHFPFRSNETVKKKILKRIKSAHYNWRIVMIQKGKTNRHPIVSSYQCIVFKVVSTKTSTTLGQQLSNAKKLVI